MNKNKVLKTLVIVLAVICAALALVVISSGVAVMQYRARIPRIIMKQGVTITEGDTIKIEDVAEVSDNMEGYLIGAVWMDGNEDTDKANYDGLIDPEGTTRHSINVSEGTGQLKVHVTVWGSNKEFTGGETVVTVKPKQ
ncbi:MAG: hypothetical protein K6G75_02165 [Lachnospiraceae bacterium]|nr:hypothetical protein [Lachnospiraceae bacterium]